MRLRGATALSAALAFLVTLAIASAVGPFYRSFYLFEININEAWYLYHAKALLTGEPLYPPLQTLITNNYPPLSFYTLAGIMRVTEHPIWAARLFSFAALTAITALIYFTLRRLSVGQLFSAIAAVAYFATMNRTADRWVWVNDFQLMAQAIMLAGFYWFLTKPGTPRDYPGPTFVMVIAGFFKNNLIGFPLATLVISFRRGWKPGLVFVLSGLLFSAAGLAACWCFFGPDFFANLLWPRPWSAIRSLKAFEDIGRVPVQTVAWVIYAALNRDGKRGQLINTVAFSTAFENVVTRGSDEVHYNAGFDFIIAVHMAFGCALNSAADLLSSFRINQSLVAAVVVLLISCRLLFGDADDAFHVLYRGSYRDRIKTADAVTMTEVDRVRSIPGAVFCAETLICYLAGKPFVVDPINVFLRMKVGVLPPDTLARRYASGSLTFVPVNQYAVVGNR